LKINVDSIASLLTSKNLKFDIEGVNISVKKISAIGSQVRESLCYYVGNNSDHIKNIKNSILFCKYGIEIDKSKKNTIIFTKNPQLYFYYASHLFNELPKIGVHQLSEVDRSLSFGKNVSVGPFCNIEESTIGDNVTIESGVKIYKGSIIGDNVQIQSNSVIGATGVLWAWAHSHFPGYAANNEMGEFAICFRQFQRPDL